MLAVLGFLALFIGVLVSVMLHEGGHFLTARKFGMKATQFFVGFGPTLWSRTKGETEYGVKALPVGGFVKIVGMTPLEEVAPGDEDRAFFKQPAPQRALVLAAGSLVHFCLAIILSYGVVVSTGLPNYNKPVIGTVSTCLTAKQNQPCSDPKAIPAPAAHVLKAGDKILAIDGQPVDTWDAVVKKIRPAAGREVQLLVERDGKQQQIPITPVRFERPSPDGKTTETVGAIGVTVGRVVDHYGPVAAVGQTKDVLGLMLQGTYDTIAHKLGSVTKLYSKDRDPTGIVGVVGAGPVSGDILSAQGEPMSLRIANIVFMLAGLNLFVGIFNLLPLLPLDGGHIAILGFEQARDRAKRLFGYRGPLQRVDLTKLMPITYAVVFLFAGVTLLLLGADIVNPIRLTQ